MYVGDNVNSGYVPTIGSPTSHVASAAAMTLLDWAAAGSLSTARTRPANHKLARVTAAVAGRARAIELQAHDFCNRRYCLQAKSGFFSTLNFELSSTAFFNGLSVLSNFKDFVRDQ
jgi:hypothetical protein